MNLNIRYKGFEASDSIKDYVEEHIVKLEKFLPPTVTMTSTLTDQDLRKTAEFTFHHQGINYVAKQTSENMLQSIDDAIDKLMRQLEKAKGKKTQRTSSIRKMTPEI